MRLQLINVDNYFSIIKLTPGKRISIKLLLNYSPIKEILQVVIRTPRDTLTCS